MNFLVIDVEKCQLTDPQKWLVNPNESDDPGHQEMLPTASKRAFHRLPIISCALIRLTGVIQG